MKKKNSKKKIRNENLRSKFSFLPALNHRLPTARGFSLLEILIYIGSLSMVLFIVVNSILLMSDSYADLKITQRINQTAVGIIERVGLDIRWSNGLGGGINIFDIDSGSLSLNVIDDLGASKEVRYYLEGSDLKMKDADSAPVSMNPSSVKVDKFRISFVDTGISNLIKIELKLSYDRKNKTNSSTFYNSFIMRESY